MSDSNSLPKNFEDARELYESMPHPDLVAQTVAKDALIKMLMQRTKEAETDSFHDGLTGISNRKGLTKFFDERRQQFRRATDAEKTDLMIMLDLDKFKEINDTYGHEAGDRTLQTIAKLLGLSARSGDQMARFGGDEFVGILLSASPEEGRIFAERLQANAAAFASADPTVKIPTFSTGVIRIDYHRPFSAAYKLVDTAMYHAKHAGGDRFYIAEPGIITLPE